MDSRLKEAAKSTSDASNLAMTSIKSSNGVDIFLFDPKVALASIKKFGGIGKPRVLEAIKNSGYGCVGLEPTKFCGKGKTYTVQVSAAKSKWGPLMYDIGMTLVSPAWVTSSRTSTSGDATGVWNYYLKNRPDVEHEYMKGVNGNCGHPSFSFDMEKERIKKLKAAKKDPRFIQQLEADLQKALEKVKTDSRSYRFRMQSGVDTSGLKTNATSFANELNRLYGITLNSEDVRTIVDEYFGGLYKGL